MNNSTMLKVSSLIAIVLLSIHISLDVVLGKDRGGINQMTGMAILLVLLVGTLLVPHKRSGQVIMMFTGLMSLGMPVLHLRGVGVSGEFLQSPYVFPFMWTLYLCGTIGPFIMILAALEMRAKRSGDGR